MNLVQRLFFAAVGATLVALVLGAVAYVGGGLLGLILWQSLAWNTAKVGALIGMACGAYVGFRDKSEVVGEVSNFGSETLEIIFEMLGEGSSDGTGKVIVGYVLVCVVLGHLLF